MTEEDDKQDKLATKVKDAVESKTSSGQLRAVRTLHQTELNVRRTETDIGDPDSALADAIRDIVDANVKLIRTVQKNEEKQEGMRRQLARMSTTVYVAGLSVIVCAIAMGVVAMQLRRDMAQSQSEIADLRETTTKTLRAVSVGTRALAVKVEADTSMTPAAEERARSTAYEAQEAALEAEKATSAPGTPTHDEATKRLLEVKKRAQALDAAPDPALP